MKRLYSHPAGVSPNSSAILTLTVLASLEEIVAVLRTAALLARSFKIQLSVDLLEKETLVIDPDDIYDASAETFLSSVQTHLHEPIFSTATGFVLEANFTAASFVLAGNISVRIRMSEPVPRGRQS